VESRRKHGLIVRSEGYENTQVKSRLELRWKTSWGEGIAAGRKKQNPPEKEKKRKGKKKTVAVNYNGKKSTSQKGEGKIKERGSENRSEDDDDILAGEDSRRGESIRGNRG